jgi:hypothetical protein
MNYLPLIMLFVVGTMTAVGVGGAIGYRRGVFNLRRAQKVPSTPSSSGSVCSNCGSNVPLGTELCENCRTPVAGIRNTRDEDNVYNYIVNHQGIISISVASEELGIPVEQLKEITERLKREGKLS